MTNTTLDKFELGDLLMDLGGDLGTISLVETDKFGTLYFVLWFSGYLQGYTTAHKLGEIEIMRKNLKLYA
jgi:hypothetical protein